MEKPYTEGGRMTMEAVDEDFPDNELLVVRYADKDGNVLARHYKYFKTEASSFPETTQEDMEYAQAAKLNAIQEMLDAVSSGYTPEENKGLVMNIIMHPLRSMVQSFPEYSARVEAIGESVKQLVNEIEARCDQLDDREANIN